MSESKIKKTLEALQRQRKKLCDFRAKLEINEFQDYQRRRRRSSRTIDRFWDRALQQAGLDTKVLEKLHQTDDDDAERFRQRQLESIERHAARLAKRRETSRRKMHEFLKKNFSKHVGNPTLLAPIKTATSINGVVTAAGNGSVNLGQANKGVWNNKVQATLSAGSGSGWGIANLTLFYDFVWQSTVSGIAEAGAWFLLDGTYSLSAKGKCLGTRESGILETVSVEIGQPVPASGTPQYSETVTILDREVSAGCSSRSGSGVLDEDDFRILSKPGIPIVAGLPTIVTASVSYHCYSEEDAHVGVDAESQSSFGLNIPTVYLAVAH